MSATQHAFCGVPTPTGKLIYAGPHTRSEFDRIPLPAHEYEWVACTTQTIIQNDGRQWQRRVTAKSLDDAATGISVIFQWVDYRPTPCAEEAVETANCHVAAVQP